MFSDLKAAQIAGYLLARAEGRMPHLKLMKLMYLADREALRTLGRTISNDRLVAMPHGPVLSQTLDLIHADVESDAWASWVAGEANYMVRSVRSDCSREDFGELSVAELRVLDSTWHSFGHLSKWQIRDYTHAHCPEWSDPGDTSTPITFAQVFRALGFSPDVAAERDRALREQDRLSRTLAAIG